MRPLWRGGGDGGLGWFCPHTIYVVQCIEHAFTYNVFNNVYFKAQFLKNMISHVKSVCDQLCIQSVVNSKMLLIS